MDNVKNLEALREAAFFASRILDQPFTEYTLATSSWQLLGQTEQMAQFAEKLELSNNNYILMKNQYTYLKILVDQLLAAIGKRNVGLSYILATEIHRFMKEAYTAKPKPGSVWNWPWIFQ